MSSRRAPHLDPWQKRLVRRMAFFYASAALFLLAAAYHLGATSATAQATKSLRQASSKVSAQILSTGRDYLPV